MTGTRANHRRRFLGRLLGALAFLSGLSPLPDKRAAIAQDGELPHLPVDDPTARALLYVEDATEANASERGQNEFCHNCRYFKGDDDQTTGWAGCEIFRQNTVAAEGWCNTWIEQP